MLKKLSFFILLIAIGINSLHAIEIDTKDYQIKNIYVDQVSTNAEIARQNAINSAYKQAFNLLLHKFFTDTNEIKVPLDNIIPLVSSLEIKEEKISDRRYRATINISFNPEQTGFFITNKILNKTPNKISILIVPLFNENGMIKLWQKSNNWLTTWYKAAPSPIVNFKIPTGDLNDIDNFQINHINDLSKEKIEELKRFYQVDKILVAQLYYNYKTTSDNVEFSVTIQQLNNMDKETLVAKSDGEKSDNINLHLKSLSEKVMANIESGWISYNDNIAKNANQQGFLIYLKDIKDLLGLKKRFTRLNIVKTFHIESISSRYAYVIVEFTKKPLQIFETLKDLGFKITKKKNVIILQINDIGFDEG